MNILIAPCAFKGSLSAGEAARTIAAGLHAADPNIKTQECPLADGGEGTLTILLRALGGQEFTTGVLDPLGREIQARYGLLDAGSTALIEIAQAAGLTLLKPRERDPLKASSYGVGQLISAALDQGARQIWIGLGGSATVDGGAGMLQA
ncbi:MAG TPA: glycerate kinase, partial [Candidatus Fraserbacteria bacterium]|nr:glycerate kinase [Candidatus Fraserbacteria bacterium]